MSFTLKNLFQRFNKNCMLQEKFFLKSNPKKSEINPFQMQFPTY